MRRLAAVVLLAPGLAGVLGACSAEDPLGSPGGPQVGSPTGSGGESTSGGTAGAGGSGPCAEGETKACGFELPSHNGIKSCYQGVQTCVSGVWGSCQDGSVAPMREGRAAPGGADGLAKPLSLSSAVDCTNNPCDPYCQTFDEDPDGGVVPPAVNTPQLLQGGGVTSLAGGFQDKGLKDALHQPGYDGCDGPEDCQFDYKCDPTICADTPHGIECGVCVPWTQGSYDPTSTKPDFTVRVPCGGGIPVCNRGSVEAPAGAKIAIINGNSNQLQGNLGKCSGFAGTVAGFCFTDEPIAPGDCIAVTDPACIDEISGTKGISINSTDFAPPAIIPEEECSNNTSVASGMPNCPMAVEFVPMTYTQSYSSVCAQGQKVQWGFFAYEVSTPLDSTITIKAHTAEPPAVPDPTCGDCVTLATIPPGPESCPMSGPAPCPIDLWTALGGLPDATESTLELVVDTTPSTALVAGAPCVTDADCPAGTACSAGTCVITMFYEPFADNSQGWSLGTEWAIGPATSSVGGANYACGTPPPSPTISWASGSLSGDPMADLSPTGDNGVAGVKLGGHASTSIHDYYYLTSPVIDTAFSGDVKLEYGRWLNSDYVPYMANKVEVYNGETWVIIWQSTTPCTTDGSWVSLGILCNSLIDCPDKDKQPCVGNGMNGTCYGWVPGWKRMTHDVTAFKNSNFRVRFGFNVGTFGVYTVSSWNIDDVRVYSTSATGNFGPTIESWEISYTCVDTE